MFGAAPITRGSAIALERRVVSGLPELDRVLPMGGLVAGSLVELHADEGAGALALALRIAAHQLAMGAPGRAVVLVDATGDLYPPAAAQAGVDLARLVVVRPGPGRDGSWVVACLDEALRSRGVAAAIARVPKVDAAMSHRLRHAAERGGGLGILVRPLEERTAVSAAAVRLAVARKEAGVALEPLRIRGGVALGSWRI